MKQFEYLRPTAQQAALAAVAKTAGAKFIAGGTNLLDLMKRQVMTPDRLIDINKLPLKEINTLNNGIHIGALALNSVVAEHETVRKHSELLSQALHAGASAQLRNMATVGGNLMQRTRCPYFYDTSMPCNKREPGTGCSALKGYNRMHAIFGASEHCIAVNPSDMNVALAALDAIVYVTGTKGERQIPILDFHRLPGDHPEKDTVLDKNDLITAVFIPSNTLNHHHYLKVRDRASYAFALVSVAAGLEIAGKTIKTARLAMGGVAHKPWRLKEAEQFLQGKEASVQTFEQAAAVAMRGAKSYGDNDFKLKLAPNSIVEALMVASGIDNY
ncbi:FAD binding domain-containing protein [Pedobacter sp.]|uniref:FAD binding domain-containing protein n=1 Tax=Pedobacter sp. TaxID=1411316 RepID=UPI003D7F7D3B